MTLFPSYMPSPKNNDKIRKTVKETKKIADTGGKIAKVINAYDKNSYGKSLLGQGSAILDPINYLKYETGASIYNALSDPKKQWDINSIISSSVQTISGLKFVFSGTALAISSPFLSTSLAAMGGLHWAYNIPYIRIL